MHVGDRWQYLATGYYTPWGGSGGRTAEEYSTSQIVGDSLAINGKRYFVFEPPLPGMAAMLRLDTLEQRIYSYHPFISSCYPDSEELVFDFTLIDSSFEDCPECYYLCGSCDRDFRFNDHLGDSLETIYCRPPESSFEIAAPIGLVSIGLDGWASSHGFTCIAAEINDVTYGQFWEGPSTPTGLSANAGNGEVTLNWNPNPETDIVTYYVYGSASIIDSTTGVNDTSITVTDLTNGTEYRFRISAVDALGSVSGLSGEVIAIPTVLDVDVTRQNPTAYALHPNYPNPFNPTTRLEFDLPEQVDVNLIVYDIMGREVATLTSETFAAGYHRTMWDGRDEHGLPVPSGIYFARLVTPRYSKSVKMVLMK